MPARSLSPGKALAQQRAAWVRARATAELVRLRQAIRDARRRRKEALAKAKGVCARARLRVRDEVREFRSRELARINREATEMRNAARNQCQARRHRIQSTTGHSLKRHAAELAAEESLQRKLRAADRHVMRQQRSTARERAEESDDAVRGNLPRELRGVFDRVKRHIKGTRHKTRTEAFLHWAHEHPEDVLEYQGDATDSEVRKLVAEYEAEERRLRKTRAPSRRRRAAGDDVPF